MLEYLKIGQIIKSHGIKGEVKVMPLTDDITRFKKIESAYIVESSIKNYDDIDKYVKKISNIRIADKTVIMKIENIDNRDDADKLKKYFLVVDRADAVELPDDHYFIGDLFGCNVYENDILVGTVNDVIQTGSNDIYVIKTTSNKELLIPALKTIVKNVSIPDRRIDVEIPKGLRTDEN
jgi:16S rRNA processing protein RimM